MCRSFAKYNFACARERPSGHYRERRRLPQHDASSCEALATQVDTDFESRGLLRDRACKAEKEKADAIITEKDKHIAHLEAHLKTVSEQNVGLLATLAKSLGDAAAKDAVTKVVGFGPSSEAKKV